MAQQRPVVSRAFGAALFGIEGVRVEVQAARAHGSPRSAIIGQAEMEVREARDRIRVALQSHGLWHGDGEQGVLVNLAPAGLRKTGTGLDLPICLAVAALHAPALRPALQRAMAYGEVGLDGSLRPARGTLSAAIAARAAGLAAILVPPEAAREAAQIDGLEVCALRHLGDAASWLRGEANVLAPWPAPAEAARAPAVDLSEVRGQPVARRAIEVAAAGAHNLIFIGPPGSGKTLLARRLPTILPPLTREEALETTQIHSAAGLVQPGAGLVERRPFRAPHHSVSPAGLVGGGVCPRPGEVSLASNGVLFLDELPEFPRHVLENLRQPMEDGAVTVVRVGGRARFPARFMLAAAMNPCPCGWHGSRMRPCRCAPPAVERYRGKLSGPLLDRIDIHVELPALSAAELSASGEGEASACVRERVIAARERQLERNAPLGVRWNAHLSARQIRKSCHLEPRALRALTAAMDRMKLSARAHDRCLKLARTLADLAGQDQIDLPQVAEAISYRVLDRPVFTDGG